MATATRQQFRESLKGKRAEAVRRDGRAIRQVAQATVPIEAVTRSTEWDFLLSLVQAEIERLDAMIAGLTEAYAMDPSFDPAKMSESKATIQRAVVQRDTMKAILVLPKEILEKGSEAQLALQQYADE